MVCSLQDMNSDNNIRGLSANARLLNQTYDVQSHSLSESANMSAAFGLRVRTAAAGGASF